MTTEEQRLVGVGDAFFDEETGELVEVPADVERVAWLQEQHRHALDQEKEWEQAKRTYARALERELERAGSKSITTDAGLRSTWVNGSTTYRSYARAVRDAQRVELLTDDEAWRLLVMAADVLDVGTVREFIELISGVDEKRKEQLRLVLIGASERSGYVTTRAARQDAPARTEAVE